MAIEQHSNRMRAFTLIELLIVSVLMSVVSLALYATFNSGIKIWQRISQTVIDEDASIFLSKFRRDLSNGVRFAGIDFSGDSQQIRLPALIYSPQLALRTVGEVIYAYKDGEISRKERDFSHIYGQQEGFYESVLKDLEYCKFTYYSYDREAKEYFWEEEPAEGSLPLAVKIELEYKGAGRPRRFIQTVDIPVNG